MSVSPVNGTGSPDLVTAVKRLLASLPTLQPKATLWNAERVEMQFDHKCQGILERAWPDVYRLGLDCGCHAHMECEDTMTTTTKFDTASAAPDYHVAHGGKVTLTIRAAGRAEGRAA